MELADGVSVLDAARASARQGAFRDGGRGPAERALAWLDRLARAEPGRRREVGEALCALGLGDDPREHDVVVDFFAHADVAHWFWPEARRVLAARPEIASRSQEHWQPGAPPLRLDSVAEALRARHEALGRRDATLWTPRPAPSMTLARYRGDLCEAVQGTLDWGGGGDLSFLADAAVGSAWVASEIAWLAARFVPVAADEALAPWRAAQPRPPYRRQAPREADAGRLRWGRHGLRGVADLRAAIDADIAAARERGGQGLRPLGWIDRLLAAAPAWRPLVDVALMQIADRADGAAAWLVARAVGGGLVQHTPRALAALSRVAPADTEALERALLSASRRAPPASPGAPDASRIRTPSELDEAVSESLRRAPAAPDPGDGSRSLAWLGPLLTHGSGPVAEALRSHLPEALAPHLQAGELGPARAVVAFAVSCPEKLTLAGLWESTLERGGAWLDRPAAIAHIDAPLGDLVAELADEGRLQRACAPELPAPGW